MKHLLVLLTLCALTACRNAPNEQASSQTTDSTATGTTHGQLHTVDLKNVAGLARYLRHPLPQRPLISAHRGGPVDGYPENAIETCENTLRTAPALLELDVQQTQDGHLVLMHDDALARTSTGQGNISTSTLAYLQTLYLKDKQGRTTKYRIPTLDQALIWAKGKAILTLDIKKGLAPETILAALQQHQAQHYALVITYNFEQAARYHQLDPNIWVTTTVGSQKAWQALQRFKVDKRRMLAWLGVREAPVDVIQTLHAAGIGCMQGTLGDIDRNARQRGPKVYQALVAKGTDVLATDDVQAVAAAVASQ